MDVSVIFGVLGNISAALLFLSPVDTFWRIVKNRSTEEFESIPYTVLLLNASLWTYYGIIKPVILLVTINGFGSLMMVIYLIIFLIFAHPRMKVRTAAMMVVMNIGLLVVVIVATRLTMSNTAQVNTIGIMCDCVTVISFASPLAIIKTVVTTKSVEFMPFWLTFFYFIMGLSWTIYALLVGDTFILIPNTIGVLLGVAQLALYAWYKIPRRGHGGGGGGGGGGGALEEESQNVHLITPSD